MNNVQLNGYGSYEDLVCEDEDWKYVYCSYDVYMQYYTPGYGYGVWLWEFDIEAREIVKICMDEVLTDMRCMVM